MTYKESAAHVAKKIENAQRVANNGFSVRFQSAMISAKISRAALADKAGTTIRQIENFMHGRTLTRKGAEILPTVCRILGITAEWLMIADTDNEGLKDVAKKLDVHRRNKIQSKISRYGKKVKGASRKNVKEGMWKE